MRNPLLADALYKSREIERWGSGLERIKKYCDNVGTKVEFKKLKTGFLVTFWRVHTEVTTEVTTDVMRLLKIIKEEQTRQELQAILGLKNDEHFRKAYLVPALKAALIERTIPEKPKSRLQKYRLTKKGKQLLVELNN